MTSRGREPNRSARRAVGCNVMKPDRRCFRTGWRYRLAVLSEIGRRPLAGLASGLVRRPSSPPSAWRRLLLVGNDHIGDILYTTASLPYLAGGLPGCQVDFLSAAPADQLLAGNPFVSRVVRRDPEGAWKRIIRESRYDAIFCYNTMHHIGDLLLGLKAGIPNRIGYVHKGFSAWVTHPLTLRYPQAFAAYFRDAAASLTGQEASWPLRPQVYPSPADRITADETANRLGLDGKRPAIACFCSSRQPRGVPPAALFIAVLAALKRASPGIRIVLMGTASDQPLLDHVRAVSCPDAPILAGTLPLLPVVELLKRFNLVLTSDSGPRHLANAAGTPVAFFRNVYFHVAEAGSYGVESEIDLVPHAVDLLPVQDEEGFWKTLEKEVDTRILSAILRNLHTEG